jgi:hypothetical protein
MEAVRATAVCGYMVAGVSRKLIEHAAWQIDLPD